MFHLGLIRYCNTLRPVEYPKCPLVNVYVDLLVFTRIAGTS